MTNGRAKHKFLVQMVHTGLSILTKSNLICAAGKAIRPHQKVFVATQENVKMIRCMAMESLPGLMIKDTRETSRMDFVKAKDHSRKARMPIAIQDSGTTISVMVKVP